MNPQPEPPGSDLLPARLEGRSEPSAELMAAPLPANAWYTPAATAPGWLPSAGVHALLRQKWLIAGLFLLAAGLTIPPIWLLTKPLYKSSAVVQVSPIISRLVYKTDENGVVPFYDSYLNTQVTIIRSPAILQRVLERDVVRRTQWYTSEGQGLYGEPTPPMERLMQTLEVQPRPRTHLIDVTMMTRRAGEAKLIVDAVVDEFLKYVTEAAQEEEARLMGKLRLEQKTREERLAGYRLTRDMLGERPGIFSSEQLRTTLGAELNALESRRATLQREVTMMRWQLERHALKGSGTATAPAPASLPGQPTTLPAERLFAEDAEWRQLKIRYENDLNAVEVAGQSYGPAHSRIRQLRAVAEGSERLLRQREAQLLTRPVWAASQPAFAATAAPAHEFTDPRVLEELIAARAKEIELLDRDIRDQQGKAGTAQELARLENLIRHEEEVYNDVSRRLSVLELESRYAARIEILAYGIAHSRPDKDQRMLLTLMALCGAGGLSVGMAYLRAMSDSKIREPEQIRSVVAMPFLGQLPELRREDLPAFMGGQRVANAFSANPVSLVEGVRMVRTALLDRLEDPRSHVILVTSPMPGSGKSGFTAMLAGSLSLLGKRVLLVEADLRRPSMARRFGIDTDRGLAQVLAGTVNDQAAITRDGVWPFDVLPAGRIDAEFDPEILANGAFSACLSRWKTSYDFILLDGPPVLPVADSRILSRHCDGTVLVTRASHDTRSETLDSYALLAEVGRKVIGTVLIGGRSRGSSRYGGGYYPYQRPGLASASKAGGT